MRERHARKRLLTMATLAAVLIAALAAAAYGLTGHDGSYSRPSGIPASIPDSQVNLMELSPVPARAAPGFTLTDQDGRVRPLSAFRGKVEPGRRRLALSVDGGRGPPGPGRAG